MVRDIRRLSRAVRLGVWAVLWFSGMTGALAAQQVELVSRVDSSQYSDTGAGAERFSNTDIQSSALPLPPSISADGRYVVFVSTATNLLSDQKDVNGGPEDFGGDVFLKDLVTGSLTLVSHSMSSPATTGNLGSDRAVISADGRFVAFASRATDLVPGQTGDVFFGRDEDLLIYDRATGTITLAAEDSRREGFFGGFAMSADGRYTAFVSDASDLVPGQHGSGGTNVFLYDRVERTIRLVSHTSASSTTPAGGASNGPLISADGRFTVFHSNSGDLLPPGQGLTDNVFLYDRTAETVTLLSPGTTAAISSDAKYIAVSHGNALDLYDRDTRQATRVSDSAGRPAISADGRYVAFIRSDPDRVLALFDRVSGTATTLSHLRAVDIDDLKISADGRYVTFASLDPAAVPSQADTNLSWDVFLFDRSSGKMTLVSNSSTSAVTAGNAASYAPMISADGSRVAFFSLATDLVAGLKDLNQGQDLFAYDVSTAGNTVLTHRAPSLPSLSPAAVSAALALSADGRYVAFESDSSSLISGQIDSNHTTDVFLYDRTTKSTILVSRSSASAVTAANGRSLRPAISADGRYVVFASNATDLAPGADDPERASDVFLFDRTSSKVTLVGRTRIAFDPDISASSPAPSYRISRDGRWVAFTSLAADLVPGQQDQNPDGFPTLDVFLWDRETKKTILVSRSFAGATRTGNAASSLIALTEDSRYVEFFSLATDLIQGQVNRGGVFLYDRTTGRTVPGPAAGRTGDHGMSTDGRFFAVDSLEDLDPRAHGSGEDVYLYDRTLGTYQLVAPSIGFAAPMISADGRFIVFMSLHDLAPGFSGGNFKVYLYDRVSKAFSLVTRPAIPNGSASSGNHEPAAISADGRYVAFLSDADDLVAGQVSAPGRDRDDIFLFDRITGITTLVSRSRTSPIMATGYAEHPLLSANGRQVAFNSVIELADGDLNRMPDAYLFNLDATPPGPGPAAPCTLLDTHRAADAPALRSDVRRVVIVAGACGVPGSAKSIAVKVTVLQGTGKGNLRFFPGNAKPKANPAATLRFQKGQTRTASLTLPLATNGAGTIAILPFVAGNGTVHVVMEVTGHQ